MANANTPISFGLSGAATTPATAQIAAEHKVITVINRPNSPELWITVDGSAPAVAGPNQWYLPPGGTLDIPLQAVTGSTPLSAIGATAWSLWVEVDE